jgi:hypothetical protein
MGRYNFYDESPNDLCFMGEDLAGLSINMPKFDEDDFYYDR